MLNSDLCSNNCLSLETARRAIGIQTFHIHRRKQLNVSKCFFGQRKRNSNLYNALTTFGGFTSATTTQALNNLKTQVSQNYPSPALRRCDHLYKYKLRMPYNSIPKAIGFSQNIQNSLAVITQGHIPLYSHKSYLQYSLSSLLILKISSKPV